MSALEIVASRHMHACLKDCSPEERHLQHGQGLVVNIVRGVVQHLNHLLPVAGELPLCHGVSLGNDGDHSHQLADSCHQDEVNLLHAVGRNKVEAGGDAVLQLTAHGILIHGTAASQLLIVLLALLKDESSDHTQVTDQVDVIAPPWHVLQQNQNHGLLEYLKMSFMGVTGVS